MRTLIGLVVVLVLASVVLAAQMLSAPPIAKVVYAVDPDIKAEVIVVKPALPDHARLCADPGGGMVKCRTVGEFRTWVGAR